MRTDPDHLPFLLLSIRAEDDAADEEYQAFMRFTGLGAAGLHRARLTSEGLPAINLADWSGILLGGGPYNVSDAPGTKSPAQLRTETDMARLLRRILDQDFPFLGCCYGVGVLGTAVGARIDRTFSEPVAAVTVTRTPEATPDPLFAGLPPVFDAYGGHKEAVSWLPPHVVRLAVSTACPVQAFRAGANVYATQFHPELDADGLCTRIDVYKNHGYFAPEAAEELKAAARKHDVTHPQQILRNFAARYARRRAPQVPAKSAARGE